MTTTFELEIHEPGASVPRRLEISGPIELGRMPGEGHIEDPSVSRRHLALSTTDGRLVAADLGSSHGTTVNDAPTTGPVQLRAGDVVRIGDTLLVVSESSPADLAAGAGGEDPPVTHATAAPGLASPEAPPTPSPAARPALDDLESIASDAGVVRFRPGTAGERAAPGVAAALRRARRRLAGLGSESWGVVPQICLVDPFPDPDRPGELCTTGTIVDAARSEIWMVVSAESPPEQPLERPLAVLFGASLPAGEELGPLLAAFGLYAAGAPDPDPRLREAPPRAPHDPDAPPDVAAALDLSFVRYLVARGGEADLLRLFGTARPGRIDAASRDVYGLGLQELSELWFAQLLGGAPSVSFRDFARLSFRYLRPHRRREAEMFVYTLVGLGFTLVFPFAFRRLLDSAIPSGDMGEVLGVLGFLAAALAVSIGAQIRRTYLSSYVSSAVVRQLRASMFARLQTLSPGWFHRHQQGDVLSRMFADVAQLEEGLSGSLREGLVQGLSLVVSTCVLFTLEPVLALIVIAGAPVVALVYRGMADGAQRRSIAVQEQLSSVYAIATENYMAQPVVKAFALEGRERGRFGKTSDRLFSAERRLQLYVGMFGLSVNLIVSALRLLVLGVGAKLILDGHLTLGGLVAFSAVMSEVLNPVTTLTGVGQTIQQATGALQRVNEILDAEPDIADDPDATALPTLRTAVTLRDVSFSFTAERPTLQHVDLEIRRGSRVAIVGPTGAGKSSVLQLLQRFYDPDDGAVLVDGVDIRRVTLASLRAQLGVVFQDTFLFDGTIRDNIAAGSPNASDEQIVAAAVAAELDEFVRGLPRGYDTPVGERGGQLSGGQRQRLAIARALVRDPSILVLDEATSALDPRTERLINDTLARVGRGRTTIAVTHRLASIVDYDRIVVLVQGQVAEQGGHDELVALGGVYAGLWAEQTGAPVPDLAPFDVEEALRRIPIFASLAGPDLTAVAARMRALDLAPGTELSDGGGRLLVVRRGRASVRTSGLGGTSTVVAELAPGDTYGLSALLGRAEPTVLRAEGPVTVLVLDDEAIAGLAVLFPTVGAALQGGSGGDDPVGAVRPAGGRHLARVTIAAPVPGPGAADAARGLTRPPPHRPSLATVAVGGAPPIPRREP